MVAAVVLEEEDRTLVRVRAITRFVVLEPDTQTWNWSLGEAGRLLSELSAAYRGLGYDVQSCRIVTNPFGEFLNCSSAETALAGLGVLQGCLSELDDGASRVRCAVGAARTAEELALVPAMIAEYGDLCNVCVNVPGDDLGLADAALCDAAAASPAPRRRRPRRGELQFHGELQLRAGHPYFPAAYNLRENGESFAVGLEHGGLILRELRAEDLGAVAAPERSAALRRAFGRVRDAVEAHVAPLVEAAEAAAAARQVAFAGVDASPAPCRDVSICDLFAALGVPASAPRARGLMLSCLEDEGLAAAAGRGQLDIYTLLQCSCVCGIGLDCVPVPGDCPESDVAALLRDTGALAFRHDKALTVRLFPCPGLAAGDIAAFASEDLVDCAVFAVPGRRALTY
ncbi:phosphatase [Aureococcus anophagefferens]|nr:phosphatase [Aureococcus anophagefferens]